VPVKGAAGDRAGFLVLFHEPVPLALSSVSLDRPRRTLRPTSWRSSSRSSRPRGLSPVGDRAAGGCERGACNRLTKKSNRRRKSSRASTKRSRTSKEEMSPARRAGDRQRRAPEPQCRAGRSNNTWMNLCSVHMAIVMLGSDLASAVFTPMARRAQPDPHGCRATAD